MICSDPVTISNWEAYADTVKHSCEFSRFQEMPLCAKRYCSELAASAEPEEKTLPPAFELRQLRSETTHNNPPRRKRVAALPTWRPALVPA
ncbi:hypothetical protein AV530_002742 [Patagioenas fasciata monilis]|uniref:Uncharacterized protein n=1 Tax=Patagioenas fasciata monilis TaxID=372326 RepID=A0A1V4J6W7_PATFA|nr:hypothetical protein AV530_002742 [Patagioenas fasciata monilis]